MEFVEKFTGAEESDGEDIADNDNWEIRRQSDDEFIDDKTSFQDQNSSDDRLGNVTRDLQDALQDELMRKYYPCSDPENYVPPCIDEVDYDYDTFREFEKRTEKFKKGLRIFKEGSKESFYFAILYGVFLRLDETKDTFVEDKEVLEGVLSSEFLRCLEDKREGLYLDIKLNTFQRQSQEINDLLTEIKLFLIVYNLRKKFRYLIKRDLKKRSSARSFGLY